MKRILSFLVCTCLLLSSFGPVSVYAENDTPTITLSCIDNVETEKQLVIKASLSNASNYCGFSFGITYDNTKLQPNSATVETPFKTSIKPNLTKTENQVYFSFTGADLISENGKVVDFTFKAKNNVAGDVEFSFINLKMYDDSYSSMEIESEEIKIKIACTHKDVQWEQTKDPQCDETGLKEFECACGYYDSEEIATIDHDYEATVVLPTKTEDGYTLHTCSMCGDDYTDTPVAALGFTVELMQMVVSLVAKVKTNDLMLN